MSEKLTAEVRTEFGKGAARRTRRAGLIPAVVYAAGGEATHVNLPAHATTMLLRNNGVQAVLELDIDGKTQFVKTQQVQVDHLKRVIDHIDFLAIDAKDVKAIEAEVAAEEAAEEAAHEAAAEAASQETHENDTALDAPEASAAE